MREVKREKISGGSAVIIQIFFIFFFLIFGIFLIIFYLKLYQWILIIAIFSIVLRFQYVFSDLYIIKNQLVIEQFLIRKKVSLKDCHKLDVTFFPWIFFIQFNNGNRVYAYLKLKPNFILRPEKYADHLRQLIRTNRESHQNIH